VDDGRAGSRIVPIRDLLIECADAPEDTPSVTAVRSGGACAFFEPVSHLCAIHRQVGHSLLPVACQQFPRVSLQDERGIFVTLSHFCPTAAALLVDDKEDLRVVEGPPAFPADFPYDPLDARDALPPLLGPRVLLDPETYDRWERQIVAILARDQLTPECAVDLIASLADALRAWQPGELSLARHFDLAVERVMSQRTPAPGAAANHDRAVDDYRLVLDSVPADLLTSMNRPGELPAAPGASIATGAGGKRNDSADDSRLALANSPWLEPWPQFGPAIRRYLAAKGYGTWLAYQGRGLRSIAFYLRVALSVLRVNAALECERSGGPLDRSMVIAAIRRSDQMLLHASVRQGLARAISRVE
jgi:hypothetical protein